MTLITATQNKSFKAMSAEDGNPALTFLLWSLLFHGVLLFVISDKLRFFDEPEEIEEAITIEIMDLPTTISERSSVPDKVAPPPSKPKDDVKPAEQITSKTPPKVEEKPDLTPKPVAKETVKATEPEKAPDPTPMPEDIEEVAEDVTKTPEATKTPPPIPAHRPKIKMDAPKPEEKKEAEATAKPSFQSVLKNLAGADQVAPDQAREDQAPEEAVNRQVPVLTQPPPVSEQISISEQQALQRQLAGCWNILPGAREAEGLFVDVYMVMNPDRTVQQARIIDQSRYNTDSFFRAAADSALRALRHPSCSPLQLPPYKYEQWKTMTVRFDPKMMF